MLLAPLVTGLGTTVDDFEVGPMGDLFLIRGGGTTLTRVDATTGAMSIVLDTAAPGSGLTGVLVGVSFLPDGRGVLASTASTGQDGALSFLDFTTGAVTPFLSGGFLTENPYEPRSIGSKGVGSLPGDERALVACPRSRNRIAPPGPRTPDVE